MGSSVSMRVIKRGWRSWLMFAALVLASALLVSCGGGGGDKEIVITTPGAPAGGGGATETVVNSVTVSAGSLQLVANGTAETTITATVLDEDGSPLAGVEVDFSGSAGTLTPASTTTNASGKAYVVLTSATNLGQTNITATAEGVSSPQLQITFKPGPAAQVVVGASPASLTADGTSSSIINVTVLDANDNPIADGETLSLKAVNGLLSSLTTVTSGGQASFIYTAPISVPAGGKDTITVTHVNGTVGIALITLVGPQIASIQLSANPTSLPADGSSQATISATVGLTGGGNAPNGTAVSFSITQGGGSISATATTANGVATASLTSGTIAETATIRAEAGASVAELDVEYTPGSVAVVTVPNAILGTGEELVAVVASIRDSSGGVPTAGEIVTFSLDDDGMGSVTAQDTSDALGAAHAVFTASDKGGTVTILATWNTGGVDVIGSATVEIQNPPAFLQSASGSPAPASINIKGTGGQSTSQIVFDVKDSQSVLVADGYRVDFDIESGPSGGEELLPLVAYTENGQVKTILRSGFRSGPVSIKATYFNDTSISTTTSQITINAGPPVGEEFGMAAEYLNIAGLDVAGLEDQITINAGDVYGNPVPNNTAISFKTYNTGGQIDTSDALVQNGSTTKTLRSTGTTPEPLEGFVSVTAEANNGGRTTHITSLAVSPGTGGDLNIYAGTDGGGVYKSTDSGATWQNLSRSSTEQGQNWLDPYINDIAVDPDDNNVVYAATGYLGRGNLYRSVDGGQNWNSNNVEEVFGLVSDDAAFLNVLLDDGSDYVWLGTRGRGALLASDGESFGWGGISTNPVPGGANAGNGTVSGPWLSSQAKSETWTATYQQSGTAALTPTLDDSATDSGADGDMTGVSSGTFAPAETWTVTYAGGYNNDVNTIGEGELHVIATSAESTLTETWTVTCVDGTDGSEIFSVRGSQTGLHPQLTDISANYISDNEEIKFYIVENTDFVGGETFTFSTTRDSWTVSGSVSNLQTLKAKTGVPYTSDNGEVGFTINAGGTRPYKQGDKYTFDVVIFGNWLVSGNVSGFQSNLATTGVLYSSDNDEVSFLISEGSVPFDAADSFSFQVTASGLGYGETVNDIVKVPGTGGATAVLYAATPSGVFRSINGGLTWSATAAFIGGKVNVLALHPLSDGAAADIIYAGTEDAGVWVSTDSGISWDSFPGGLGEGLSATTADAEPGNKGTGEMSRVSVTAEVQSEYWTVSCAVPAVNGGIFTVTGSESGLQTNTVTVGMPYTSDGGELSFAINDGNEDFAVGDGFTFWTTRDSGKKIKDLLVDAGNDQLYAVTYFLGPYEAHAVGNIYSHELTGAGAMAAGDWITANSNLPQFDPPDDTTRFAQHVLTGDVFGTPATLFVGGEGINFHKATTGLALGMPQWQTSKSGLDNRIMARMPILFSGVCTMEIFPTYTGNLATFSVYIEDDNGNPPIEGTKFLVVQDTKDALGNSISVTLRDIEYADTQVHRGTWRDPADLRTNNPYVIATTILAGDTITFTYTPACGDVAPGCSGAAEEVVYSY